MEVESSFPIIEQGEMGLKCANIQDAAESTEAEEQKFSEDEDKSWNEIITPKRFLKNWTENDRIGLDTSPANLTLAANHISLNGLLDISTTKQHTVHAQNSQSHLQVTP